MRLTDAWRHRGVALILFIALCLLLPDWLLADWLLIVWAWLKPPLIVSCWFAVCAAIATIALSLWADHIGDDR